MINRQSGDHFKFRKVDGDISIGDDNVNDQVADAQLQLQLLSKDKHIASLLKELDRVKLEKLGLIDQLESIVNSSSWKITKPLRLIAETFRKLRPLYRCRRVVVSPGSARSIQQDGNLYNIIGPSPFLELSLSDSPPQGWTLIDSDISRSRGFFCCLLYFRLNESFESSHRSWVTFAKNSRYPVLLKIPAGTNAIRLDPFDAEESFEFSKMVFKEIGSIQVGLAIAGYYLGEASKDPRLFLHKIKRATRVLRREGLKSLLCKALPNRQSHDYAQWISAYDQMGAAEIPLMKKAADAIKSGPIISVIMPTFNTAEIYLRKAIESVINQVYENWELCIADDNSDDPTVKKILSEYSARDKRIKVYFRQTNGHIAEATNTALTLAQGEYVAFLDHDDEITPDALLIVADYIQKNPSAICFYSDEDKKTEDGLRFNPYFKGDFNPELLLSQNYFCHLTVYRHSLVKQVGGLQKGSDGAQDWDLALRIIDSARGGEIVHIPHILYHWRCIEGSTAKSTSCKPYVLEAQRRAVEDHIQRRGESATVNIDYEINQLRVNFHIPTPPPRISLIIPTRDMVEVLRVCIDSIFERTKYPAYDIVVIDNGSIENETLKYFSSINSRSNVTILRDDGQFNFSRLNNRAVKSVSTPLIGLMNNDLEMIHDTWLDHLVSHAVRPEVGAVGARLYFPNGLLQHGGIILGIGGVAGHSHKGRPRADVGYFNRIVLPQAVSGVTAACLVMRRSVFEEVSGLDEVNLRVAFNDVDLCLKIIEKGYRVIYQPYAELIHHESASRGSEETPEKFHRFEQEIAWMKKRWANRLLQDPYYNPNLTLLTEDYGFAIPPRKPRFWSLNN